MSKIERIYRRAVQNGGKPTHNDKIDASFVHFAATPNRPRSIDARRRGRHIQTADGWVADTALYYKVPLNYTYRNDFKMVRGLFSVFGVGTRRSSPATWRCPSPLPPPRFPRLFSYMTVFRVRYRFTAQSARPWQQRAIAIPKTVIPVSQRHSEIPACTGEHPAGAIVRSDIATLTQP
jgi:hypothetical protein